jgi:hypothetical protein
MIRDERSNLVTDESQPGHTVGNYIQLAQSRRDAKGNPYLVKGAHLIRVDPPDPVLAGPFAHREITVFCWRTPYEGDVRPEPGECIIGPHVLAQARWTDPRRHLEDRDELEPIPVLEDINRWTCHSDSRRFSNDCGTAIRERK